MVNDRFGWHPGEATVKLVPGAKKLPEDPRVVARQEEADKAEEEAKDEKK